MLKTSAVICFLKQNKLVTWSFATRHWCVKLSGRRMHPSQQLFLSLSVQSEMCLKSVCFTPGNKNTQTHSWVCESEGQPSSQQQRQNSHSQTVSGYVDWQHRSRPRIIL